MKNCFAAQNNNNKTISVIIPIFKVQDYLNRCIDSVLSQTLSDFEIILVDDGSPDNCGRISDAYAEIDSRIIVIHKANGGLSDARNAGLEIASGSFVYFLDSDDYIENDLFEFAIPYMLNDCQTVSFGFMFEYDNGLTESYNHFIKSGFYDFKNPKEKMEFITDVYMRFQIGFAVWLRIYNRNIIERYSIRFEDNNRIFAEDIYFFLCYFVHVQKMFVSDKCFYHYLQREESIMGNNRTKLNIGRFNYLAKTVLQYYSTTPSCEYYSENFPLIYLSIFDHIENSYRQNVGNISAKELKRMIYSEVEDISFFRKNLRRVKKYKKYIYKDKPKNFVLYRLNELNYYAGSSFISFWLKTKLLNIFFVD